MLPRDGSLASPTVTLRLVGLAATEGLAARLATLARPGDVILLDGPLGAGKSAFARAFLRAASGDPALEVPSPTFTLVQSYDLPDGGQAHHFDLYRLHGPDEVAELGWEEARQGIVLVEWPDRLGQRLLPDGALRLTLAPGRAAEERHVALTGWPDRLNLALAA
jgi:tRNA threonylcarbamoyladenosine biosynthesis protein TsaE